MPHAEQTWWQSRQIKHFAGKHPILGAFTVSTADPKFWHGVSFGNNFLEAA